MTKLIDELMAAVDAYAKSEYARAIAGRAPSDHEPERNAVAAIASRMAGPDRVVVPVEPTPAMLAVDAPPIERDGDFATMKYRRGIWAAMLRAAKETT